MKYKEYAEKKIPEETKEIYIELWNSTYGLTDGKEIRKHQINALKKLKKKDKIAHSFFIRAYLKGRITSISIGLLIYLLEIAVGIALLFMIYIFALGFIEIIDSGIS